MTDVKTAVFLYHDVIATPNDSGFNRRAALPYKHSPEAFSKNLDQIAFSSVMPSLVKDIDFAGTGRYLLLTFDDGGKSSISISEELANRGWKGHFFIITSRIGDKSFLNREEIREIHKMGHVIGSHSHSHPDIFCRQPLDEMLDEWKMSKDILSEILGEPCTIASVPGGDVSKKVYDSANQAGIKFLFTSDPLLRPRTFENCWVLGRIGIKVSTPLATVKNLARFHGWEVENLKWQSKKSIKRIFPPFYDWYVKRTTYE
ncbi:MAG: polysaccharide deacetylase family protein [Anaerolineaceae bacterium]|nr:MAG: polysaccharide deacetylase family protein [Anaerolineaceae bacterium]